MRIFSPLYRRAMAWARMEALLHRYVDRLGWASVALVVISALLYQWGAS